MEVHNEEEEIARHERGLRKEKGLSLTEFTRTEEENRDYRDRTFNQQRSSDMRLLNPPSAEIEEDNEDE